MKTAVLRIYIVLCCFLIAHPLIAEAAREEPTRIVATTSWTAAFAFAAGALDVHVLAPYEMRHPTEYELSPSDIATVAGAELIVFAGYEVTMPRIREAAGGGAELLQIGTDFSLATIEASIGKIAEYLGTKSIGQDSVEAIRVFYDDWLADLESSGLSGSRVITHLFHRPLAMILGFEIVGVFGPMPLEARQIAELSDAGAELIIDNYHIDIGAPLREVLPSVPAADLINFPGVGATVTLLDVLRENRKRLDAAVNR